MSSKSLLLSILSMLFSSLVFAQTWNGNASSNWNDPANWTPANVPIATSNVVIASSANVPALPANTTVNNFNVSAGAALNFNGFSLTVNGNMDINGGTLNNGSGNIEITMNGTGSQYIRSSTVNDDIIFNHNGTGGFFEAYISSNTFNGNFTLNINTAALSSTSYNSASVFNGSVTVNRTIAGNTEIFRSGASGSITAFSYTNTVGGPSEINSFGSLSTVVNGPVNINYASTAGTPVFSMRRLINTVAGGSVSVQNSGAFTMLRDTLVVNSVNISGVSGSSNDDINSCQITGNLNFSDAPTNISSTYLRNSVINGNTSIIINSASAAFYEAYLDPNTFNGNLDLQLNGVSDGYLSYNDPSQYNGNVTVSRTVAGRTEIFRQSGPVGNLNNFSYTNLAGGVTEIGGNGNGTILAAGTVNINVNNPVGNPAFTMRYLKNLTGGGTVNIVNPGNADIFRDTLVVNSFSITGMSGSGNDDIESCSITGNVTIADAAGNNNSTYLRGTAINGNTSITINSSSANFFEGYLAPNTFNGNLSFQMNGASALYTSYNQASTFNGNVTVTRSVAGLTAMFVNGALGSTNNFSLTNNVGGNTEINNASAPMMSLNGTINIDVSNPGTPFQFDMRRVKNLAGGGTISLSNLSYLNLVEDTIRVSNLTVNGFAGGSIDNIQNAHVFGTVNIADAVGNVSSTYIRNSTFENEFTYTQNSSSAMYEGYLLGNVFKGNTSFIRNDGSIFLAYDRRSNFHANLNLQSDAGVSIVDTIGFVGSTSSIFSKTGAQALSVNRLHIQKSGSASVTLNAPLTVTNRVSFAGGNLFTSAANPLLLGNNALANNASNSSHVVGPVQKTGDDAFAFPIGDGTTYKPVSITAPASATDAFRAAYIKDNPSSNGFDTSARAASLLRVSGFEYWILERVNGASNVTPTFTYSDPGSGQYITVPAEAAIARWNGSQWEDLGTGTTTGTLSGTIATAAPVTAFTPAAFTFASKNLANNPLLDLILFTYYADADNDGFGDDNNSITSPSTTAPAGYSANNTDCDDNDNSVYPGAPELCDGKDNDCDGTVDDGAPFNTYYRDQDGDGFGDPSVSTQACTAPSGFVVNDDDCDDDDNTVYPNAPELCDGKDNDCDGSVDEGVLSTYYRDLDTDGFGDASVSVQACVAPSGFVSNDDDCDDTDNTVYPNAPEICDGKDNDCDGTIDENVQATWYLDSDNDGFGDLSSSVLSCTQPTGYVTNSLDCNDADNTVYPGAPELCDGKDNDCDGSTDEGVLNTYYRDQDDDGFGDPSVTAQACSAPSGFVANDDDCDDTDDTVYPGAPELCDGKDNDCDGTIDDGAGQAFFYLDSDGDGFGDPNNFVQGCNPPTGYVGNDDDCDDADNAVYPDAPELCDGKDNDCDGTIDENVQATWYLDNDNDGFGDLSSSVLNCTQPTGYVTNSLDCDDADNTVYPGAPELCDGKDNDCDGTVDDGAGTITYYQDSDGDGFGNAAVTVVACAPPTGFVTNDDDCDDTDDSIYPGAPELCDGKDNDCNGTVDDGAGTITYYQDSDGDGFGNAAVTIVACAPPTGYVANDNDCDDTDDSIYPGAPELCDGKDNDCNGTIDDGAGSIPVVSGPRNMCPFEGTGQTVTFTAAPVTGVFSYQWTVPPTVSIVSGQGTNTLEVLILPGFGASANKQVRVTSTSACGTSPVSIYYLLAQFPSTPGLISGPAEVCGLVGTSAEATYSISPVTAATSYAWSVSAGMVISSHPNGPGANDTIITVQFAPGFSSGTVTVNAVNNCGNSNNNRQLAVRSASISTPGLIQGPTNACLLMPSLANPSGVQAEYSIRKVTNANSYNWIVPSGASIVSHPAGNGVNDTIIIVSYSPGFTGGNITVTASGNCGTSLARSLAIQAGLKPGTTAAITSTQLQACPDRIFRYSVPSLPSNSNWLQWTVPANAVIISGQGSSSIDVAYTGAAISGNITATPSNGCATGGTRSLAVNLGACGIGTTFAKAQSSDMPSCEVSLYPNPTHDQVQIRLRSFLSEPIQIRILDLQGRVYETRKLNGSNIINTGAGLRPGQYLAEIRQGSRLIYKPFVKL